MGVVGPWDGRFSLLRKGNVMESPRAEELDCWRLCPGPRAEELDCWRLCLRPGDEVLDCCRRSAPRLALGVVGAGLSRLCETSGRLQKFANEPKDALAESTDLVWSIKSEGGSLIDDGRSGRRISGPVSEPSMFEIAMSGSFGSLTLSLRKGA